MLKVIKVSDLVIAATFAVGLFAFILVLSILDERGETQKFIQQLRSQDPSVCSNAIEALGKIGKPAVEPLIGCLKDESWVVRRSAAEALGKIGDAQAVQPLIGCLKDKESDVRESAAEALGNIGDTQAVQPLIECLKDEYLNVCSSAAEALGKIGEPAIQLLIGCLKDEDSYVRGNAAWVLGKTGDARAVQPLIGCLKDEDSDVRRRVAEALGEIGDARAVQPLIGCLKDESWVVRSRAAVALGKIGDARAVQPLTGCLKDRESDVRESAVEALGNIGDARAVQPLIGCLKDEDSDVRRRVAEALGEIGDTRAVQPLIGCLKDEDSDDRRSAAEALNKLGYRPETDTERAIYLIAKQEWNEVVKIGKPAVQPLIGCLKDKGEDVRRSAVEALGKTGDPKAIPALRDILPDWNSNSLVIESLTKLGWKPSSEADRVYVWISHEDGDSLRRNWARVKRILLDDVKSDNRRKIENAICTFISLGNEEAIDELIRVLDTYGNKEMAETYLNCGHEGLRGAAESWAKRHGYLISFGSGAHEASWGSWR